LVLLVGVEKLLAQLAIVQGLVERPGQRNLRQAIGAEATGR